MGHNTTSNQLYKAGKGTRTLDLLITNQLRYQLRYSSELPTSFIIYGISCFGKSIFSFFSTIFHRRFSGACIQNEVKWKISRFTQLLANI